MNETSPVCKGSGWMRLPTKKYFSNWIAPVVGVLMLAALLLFEYGEAFNFYFVGDDFGFIQVLLQDKWRILWSSRAYYHYCPLSVLINALPACFGIFEPRWYVLVGFLFFLMSSALIAKLYQSISGNLAKGFLAAMIFATAHLNSEVLYWKTGNTTIAMIFFSLVSLIFFIRSLKKNSKALFAGCVMAYAVSMLCIEQGLITLAFLALYDLIFWTGPRLRTLASNKRATVIQFLRRLAILSTVPVLHTAVKLALHLELSPMPFTSRDWRPMFQVMFESLWKLLDFNEIFRSMSSSHWKPGLALTVILFLYFGYILAKRSSAGLFLLVASLGSVLAISVGTGGVVPRYFCLSLAFYACFLSLFIDDVAGFSREGMSLC